MAKLSEIKKQIDYVSRSIGYGSLSSAYANALYGINHRGAGNPIAANSDLHGLTFFTRPDLNLTYDNAAMNRVFIALLNQQRESIPAFVHATLDQYGARSFKTHESPLVDNRTPFIPLLTNTLESISGFPDFTLDTYTSPEGIYKEAWSMVDSPSRIHSTYDVTANFRNIMGDPITLMFLVWCQYASLVYEGLMMPYPWNVVENRIDYTTRIWRVVLDRTKRYVQKIAAVGAAFPTASPLGAAFNYSSDEPINRDNDQISVPFRCMGIDYNDPILFLEFNSIVIRANPMMADGNRNQVYRKLSAEERQLFNYSGYPRIDPETQELEWWVPNDESTPNDPAANIFGG